MRSILFVVPGFHPGSAAAQALLAARGLLANGFSVHAAGWGGPNFLTNELAACGAVVHDLGRSRLLEIERQRRLYQLASSVRPITTLAWDLPALRLASLLPRRLRGHMVAADVLPISPGIVPRERDRWMLGRAERIIVSGPAEFELALRLGMPEARLALLRPGVPGPTVDRGPSIPIPAGRYLLSVGPLERSKGLQDAIWSLEILRYLYEDLTLAIVGDGPDRQRLQEFVGAIQAEAAVHFLGQRPDLDALYSGAAAVWIPSLANRGARVALEAMGAGRPVIASRQPKLEEVVIDGETGFLVSAGDKVALAKRTRKLLDDSRLADQMGQAGRQRVGEQFSSEAYVLNLMKLLI